MPPLAMPKGHLPARAALRRAADTGPLPGVEARRGQQS